MSTLVTHQAVSAALRKAGHTRSTLRPSRIRGMPEWNQGYKVQKWDETIRVEWRPASIAIRQTPSEKYTKMLDEYFEVLDKAGFVVTKVDTGFTPRLVVTGRKS